MDVQKERRYGDEEVKAILRLAMGEGAQSAAQDGLTLDELVRVASEAGLDPERVRSAAERYESGETSEFRTGLLGFRRYTEMHRTVDGEVTEENKAQIVAELRSAFQGPTGETSQLGRTFEWNSATEFRGLQVTFSPEGGRTRIRARLSAWGTPWSTYVLTGVTTFAIVAALTKKTIGPALDDSVAAFVIGAAIWLGAMGVARFGVARWYKAMVARMKDAMDRSEGVLSQGRPSVHEARTKGEDDVRIQLGQSE